jgi:hypothetical protein
MQCSNLVVAMHKIDIIPVYGIAAPARGNPTVNEL